MTTMVQARPAAGRFDQFVADAADGISLHAVASREPEGVAPSGLRCWQLPLTVTIRVDMVGPGVNVTIDDPAAYVDAGAATTLPLLTVLRHATVTVGPDGDVTPHPDGDGVPMVTADDIRTAVTGRMFELTGHELVCQLV